VEVFLEVRVWGLHGNVGDAADDDEGNISEPTGIANGGALHFRGQSQNFLCSQRSVSEFFTYSSTETTVPIVRPVASPGGREGAVIILACDAEQPRVRLDHPVAVGLLGVPPAEVGEVNVELDSMVGNYHIADRHVECQPICDDAEGNGAGSIEVH
jgi:hypothetical protein